MSGARKWISVSEAAAAMEISRQRVLQLCQQGRIVGAQQVGSDGRWAIPAKIVRVRGRRKKTEQ